MATKSRNRFDIKASRPFYASVGVTDLAVETVRKELKPAVLRDRAVTVVTTRVDALSKDAKAVPAKVQTLVDDNVSALNSTYVELVKRGESLVGRIRRQRSTQEGLKAAETTVAKAKTTRTQAATAARSTTVQARKAAARQAKKSSTAPRSSAKATVTAAKKTASSATRAVADAAVKVGD